MGSTRSKWRNNQLAFYDGSTFETVRPVSGQYLYDDFTGALNTDLWEKLDVAGGTFTDPALSVWAGELAANNANEAAGVYGGGNVKCWDIDKGWIFECRLAQTVLCAGTAEIHIGMTNDSYGVDSMLVAAGDEQAIYAYFVMDGGLDIDIYTDDNTAHTKQDIDTTVNAVVGTYNIFRIDASVVTDVKFYVDGVGVATGTTFDMSEGTDVMFQPWVAIYKHDNANGLGQIKCDYIKIWQASR